jgi:Ca2+-binding RTX toxin-like protein
MGPLPAALGKLFLSATMASGLPVGLASGGSAEQTTCTYDEPSKTVTVLVPDSSELNFVLLTAEAGVISFQEVDPTTFDLTPKQPCGAATTSNTDLIRTQGGAQSEVIQVVDQTFGAFAPGATAESTGVSEIEFEFQPLGLIGFAGSPTPAVVRLGTLGANLNGDDDVDVTFLVVESALGYAGSPGDDDIASIGGLATGDPTTRFLSAFGEAGNDRLTAGSGIVQFHGGSGTDAVTGGPESDELGGGPGPDRVLGGAGIDVVQGDAGNDVLLGGPGRDVLLGGGGRDRCVGGPGKDSEKKCER